jgi:hypothetical protein
MRLPILLIALFLATGASAEPTHLMVRAQAMDAKFIGDHMGGVAVTVTDAKTGAVLARGQIKGGTGDTAKVVRNPRTRGAQIADAQTAGFDAVLDLKRPTLVRVDAQGPLGNAAATIRVSSQLWMIPGRDVTGDGLVLNFPGLAVEPSLDASGESLKITAKVSPMCGCPIDAGGLWDAANYKVEANLTRDGKVVASVPLAFAGRTGEFAGSLAKPPSGRYGLMVVATDAKSPNAGVAEKTVTIGR